MRRKTGFTPRRASWPGAWDESLIAGRGTRSPGRLDDLAQPFRLESMGVRGRLVRLGPALDRILEPLRYPPPVAEILAECITMASVLATGLKYEGVFTLQTTGDGPVGTMVADVTNDGALRGYARFDADRLAETTNGAVGSVPRLLGAGHMAFTVDQGPDTERYQGITELTGATLADCAHTYFRQSEQLETAIAIRALAREDDTGFAAGGRACALVLQHLPTDTPSGSAEARTRDEAEDEAWRRAVILMSSLTAAEMLDPDLPPRDLLYRLFHQEGIRVYRPKPLAQGCRCSRDRVASTLRMLARSEVDEMSDDGTVTVTCEFCKADYVFGPGDLDAVYAP